MSRTVAVALPVPRLGLLTYAVPEGLTLAPGVRVSVPLGRRTATGFVVALDAPLDPGVDAAALKPILRVIDETPLVPPPSIALARWVAEYYAAGPGETLALTLPPAARGRAHAFKTTRVAALTPAGRSSPAALTPRQRAAIVALEQRGGRAALPALAADGVTAAVLGALATKGLVSIATETVDRDPLASPRALTAPAGAQPLAVTLTAEQQAALVRLDGLASARRFAVAVLHGVTGSGKTQVYLRLADAVRRGGRRVLILVPEIALTPAMAALLRAAFGDQVAIQHSALSMGERHDQWHRIRRGDVSVVVGTRSAVFAPIEDLGLVVVDEEHDTSYKQDESPRYHGRDVAIVRAQQAGALAVLGSATPSLETFQHATTGHYTLVSLERRILDRPLASVRVVDMREVFAAEGPDAVLSPPLKVALAARLADGEQSVVLLNRRGYAAAYFCRACAASLECPHCSITLTVHRAARRAVCHYCDHERPLPPACPACGGEFLDYRGVGTERIEAEVQAALPGARIARVDRDTTRRRGAIDSVLRRFAARELDVLVGTQMIAKGHDFPEVTLVGVVSADIGLGVADFRAAERTFQLLTQVVGRAGRGTRPGEAIIQTLYPKHYGVALAARQDYAAFFEAELTYRRAMHYPPTVSLVNIVVRATTADGAMRDATTLARALRVGRPPYEVLGPAAAPLPRLRGDFRVQVILKGTKRAAMRQAVQRALAQHPTLARRTMVDIDPLTML
jgi:primosomal protein N' (replication factor Y) (superfamily II helicase)